MPPEKKGKALAASASRAAKDAASEAEAISKRLQDLQESEVVYARRNAPKTQSLWLGNMRQAKLDALRAQTGVLQEDHQRALKRKETLLEVLEKQLDEAEELRRQAILSHEAGLQKLLALQKERLAAIQEAFEANLQALADAFAAEGSAAEAAHAQRLKELADVAVAMAKYQAAARDAAKARFEAAREEAREQASEDYNILKVALQTQVHELERALNTRHQAYLRANSNRIQTVATMSGEDSAMAADVEARSRQLSSLGEAISRWRSALSASARDWEARNAALALEKGRLAMRHRTLMAKSNRQRSLQAHHLQHLCLTSAALEGELQTRVQQGERILRLSQLCGKLEASVGKSSQGVMHVRPQPTFEASNAVAVPIAPLLLQNAGTHEDAGGPELLTLDTSQGHADVPDAAKLGPFSYGHVDKPAKGGDSATAAWPDKLLALSLNALQERIERASLKRGLIMRREVL